MIESNRIEFKRELNDNLEKEVVAFLNYKEGGLIYIGIDDKTGNAVELNDIDKLQLQIKDRLKNNILPSTMGLFDIVCEDFENRSVIKIIIASGNEKPYYLKKAGMSEKGCFIRIGSASEPMQVRMIEDLFAKRIRNSIGKIESPRQDLTFEQLKIYYNETGLTLNDKFASTLELRTSQSTFNYAAYLLSDSNGTSIKVAKYRGTDRIELIENNEYGYCSLIKATKRVLDKLNVENRTLTRITRSERIEKRQFDPIAMREAVINAIIHNDYSNEVPPKFELFADRIEITSIGGLPVGFNEQEFFDGFSFPRNKELMRVFKDLELVEYLGSGIPRILQKYNRSAFFITDHFIRITFPFEEGENFRPVEGQRKQVETMDLILAELRANPKVTIPELAERLTLNVRTIARYINLLREQNLLEREGSKKSGTWIIVE